MNYEPLFSFLSSFKTFFFNFLFFIIFGSVFMVLYESLCSDSTACSLILKPVFKNIIINFTEPKFIVFSFIIGLISYEFGRACFKSTETILKTVIKKESNSKEESRPNDIDIFNYLDKGFAKDVYVMQLFYSSIARMLLGLVIFVFFFYISFSQELIQSILSVTFIIFILFWINRSADAEVHNLRDQIKKVIEDPRYNR